MLSQQFELEEMLDQSPEEEIPDHVKHLYKEISRSMQSQINKKKMREFSNERLDSWVRSIYRLNEDERIVQKHKMIASQISNYLFKGNQGYKIPLHDVRHILQMERQLEVEKKQKAEQFNKIKQEVKILRNKKRQLRGPSKIRNSSLKIVKPVLAKPITIKKPLEQKNKIIDPQVIDYDFIYGKWMKHVETKSTSKSYWYIHEYIGRYILNFGIKKGSTKVNKTIVQEFLDDYGKGKAAKTMNHYNRVAKYFLEFCLDLEKTKS